MKKLILTLLFACTPAWAATTRYFCDCSTSSHGSCVAGADANAGTSSALPKQTISAANAAFQSTVGGDQFLFCKGGAWPAGTGVSATNSTSTATALNPIYFDGYAPSWGGTAKPILRFSSGVDGFYTGSNNAQFGIVIRNLELRGTATADGMTTNSGSGVYASGGWNYVTLDSLTIDGFGRALLAQGGVAHVTLKNSTIKNSSYSGIFAALVDDFLIESNVFDNNGACAFGAVDCTGSGGGQAYNQHSLYFNGGNRVTLRYNDITRSVYNSTAAPSSCAGPAVTGHGIGSQWLWEGNYVHETASVPGCDGMGYGDTYGQTNEGITGFKLYRNTVAGIAGNSVGGCCSPGIEIDGNMIYGAYSGFSSAINLGVKNFSGALSQSAAKVRGNSIYITSGTSGAAIYFGNTGTGTGTGNVVANNLVVIASGSSAKCWDVNGKAASDFAAFDFNLCFNQGSGGNTPPTGLNTHGLTVDPLLVATPTAPLWSMAIQAGSPARNAGTNAHCTARDRLGLARDASCDIGAHEYGASATTLPPSTPVNLR